MAVLMGPSLSLPLLYFSEISICRQYLSFNPAALSLRRQAITMVQETVALLKAHWILVLLSTVIAHLVYNYTKGELWRIPGPWLRGVSSLPRILSVYNNNSHDEDIKLHRKYGNIVRLAPNLLSIADPTEINQLYGIGMKFYKSRFYNLSTTYDDEGLVPDTFVLTDKVKLHHVYPMIHTNC